MSALEVDNAIDRLRTFRAGRHLEGVRLVEAN